MRMKQDVPCFVPRVARRRRLGQVNRGASLVLNKGI